MARHLGDDWVVPALDDLNRAWFTSGVITVQVCKGCSALQHPPDELCGSCQGSDFDWRECSGEGRIESVAVVTHPLRPALAEHVPFAVVVVSLDDAAGVNAIGNVVNRPAREVAIGQRVRAVFEPARSGDETLLIPQWAVV